MHMYIHAPKHTLIYKNKYYIFKREGRKEGEKLSCFPITHSVNRKQETAKFSGWWEKGNVRLIWKDCYRYELQKERLNGAIHIQNKHIEISMLSFFFGDSFHLNRNEFWLPLYSLGRKSGNLYFRYDLIISSICWHCLHIITFGVQRQTKQNLKMKLPKPETRGPPSRCSLSYKHSVFTLNFLFKSCLLSNLPPKTLEGEARGSNYKMNSHRY